MIYPEAIEIIRIMIQGVVLVKLEPHTVLDKQVIQFNCGRLWTTWDLSTCYRDLVKAIRIQNERENHLKNCFFEVL